MRQTKIIATVGPATSGEVTINDLLAAGVDVFRLNFSHGTHESHGESLTRIRVAVEQQRRRRRSGRSCRGDARGARVNSRVIGDRARQHHA